MGSLINMVTGHTAKRAAKKQAAATMAAAQQQASSDAFSAQAAAQQQATIANREAAVAKARDLFATPAAALDVNLAPDSPDSTVDPNTGQKRSVRSQFTTGPSTSGINI